MTIDKHAQYSPTARMTANGWIRTQPAPVRRPSWIARFIAWIME